MQHIRSILFAGAAATLASSAIAADMPVKAPVAPVAVVYNWSGFYLGGHLGGAWGGRDGSNAELQAFAGGPFFSPPDLPFDTRARGVIGGAQAGYNWQVANRWLIGIEADVSGAGLNGGQTYTPIPPGPGGVAAAPPSFVTMSREVNLLATVRGRFGATWDRILVFGTGGIAFSHADYFGQDSRQGGLFVDTANFSKITFGWVAGGGLEFGLSPNWSLRGEYLYYSTLGVSQTAVLGGPVLPPPPVVNFDWDRTNLHVVRAALNYRFGAPLVARY